MDNFPNPVFKLPKIKSTAFCFYLEFRKLLSCHFFAFFFYPCQYLILSFFVFHFVRHSFHVILRLHFPFSYSFFQFPLSLWKPWPASLDKMFWRKHQTIKVTLRHLDLNLFTGAFGYFFLFLYLNDTPFIKHVSTTISKVTTIAAWSKNNNYYDNYVSEQKFLPFHCN